MMDAPTSATSALPTAATSSAPQVQLAVPSALLDVETTNWNAVKILAAQHKIPINLLESARDAVATQPAEHIASHDFGAGTPFVITAARLDTGRVVFRFRSRQPAAHLFNPAPSTVMPSTAPATHDGIPRSSSSGVICSNAPLSHFEPIDYASTIPKASTSNNLFRKTGNLNLKHSKSIPVLRRKVSSTFAAASPVAMVSRPANGAADGPKPTSQTDTFERSRSLLPAPPLGLSSQNAAGHACSTRTATVASASMARTGSSPVSGPHASRHGPDQIQEGDVLGAVLGLGKADLWPKSHSDVYVPPQQPSRRRRPSSSSSGASLGTSSRSPPPQHLRLPEFHFDSKMAKPTRPHQLKEAQSFESNASDTTARGEDKEASIDRYPVDLRPFLRKASPDANTYDARVLVFDVIQCYQRPSPAYALFPSVPARQQPRESGESRNLLYGSVPSLGNSPNTEGAQPSDFATQAHALPTSASPGDDPRFAVWAVKSARHDGTFVVSNRLGETQPDQDVTSQLATSAGSSPVSTTRRRNRKSQLPFSNDGEPSNLSSSVLRSSSPAIEQRSEASAAAAPRGKAILLAASAARLVAELTAEIDLTLRSDFFYTYREFMTPLDLLELLILRFEWAVSEPSSAADDSRRRIVRVRTYVVIKHWLQHHFDFDFLPNRSLRQRLATWLNTIAKDERIIARPADLNIVNSLRKLVRGLKETYSQSGVGGLLLHDAGRVTDSPALRPKTDSLSTFGSSSHDSGNSVAVTATSASSGEPGMISSGSASSITDDVNLDFSDDQNTQDAEQVRSPPTEHTSTTSPGAARMETSDATRAAQKAAAESVLVSHRHTLAPISFNPSRPLSTSAAASPAPLPLSSNAWSRAFVQTVGRLSKFKRVLGSRGLGLDGHNELDAEPEECSDLLFVKGGLDSLLRYFAVEQARHQSSSGSRQSWLPRQRPLSLTEEANEDEEEGLASQASEDSTGQEETPSLAGASTNPSTPASSINLTGLPDKHSSSSDSDPQGLGISPHGGDEDDFSVTMQGEGLRGLDPRSIRPLASFSQPKDKVEEHLHHATSEQTLRSISRMSMDGQAEEGTIAAKSLLPDASVVRNQHRISIRDSILSNGAPRIVQIDDIDLSSDDDDFAVRKALRRLPGARDLRQAKTVKDLELPQLPAGRESIDSMASSMFRQPAATRHVHMSSFGPSHVRSVSVDSAQLVSEQLAPVQGISAQAPPLISTVQSEMLDPDEALQGYELVKGFRLDDIESDDEEPGDVEAALRRLEGIIDKDRQKEKVKRVERLWQRSLARNAKDDAGNDADELDATAKAKHVSQASVNSKADGTLSSSLTGGSLADVEDDASNASIHPCTRSVDEHQLVQPKSPPANRQKIRAQASFLDLQDSSSTSESESVHEPRQAPTSPPELQQPIAKSASSAKSADKVPRAPMQENEAMPAGRKPLFAAGGPQLGPGMLVPSDGRLAPLAMVHRSFLLSYRSESIARQMCLIEAELLCSVTWDELASSRWQERRFGAEVTDWEAFYRDRVRDRLEAQRLGEVHQERAVEAIVARFNLTSNWVASEVVLTQNVDERAAVISKLIRVAWKCYLHSNFASLAQIIFGLSTPWVERLRRTWNRVGYFEMRMWRDLNSFVGPRHNFRHLRNAMLQLAESNAGDSSAAGSVAGSMAGDAAKTAQRRGCIPFFGLFVSDLMQFDAMPTFLDPTSPTLAASTISTQQGKTQLQPADADAFAHLAPLPPSVQLEPLINILKLRGVAEVIRQVSAFQNAAKNYSAMFEAEKNIYVRCLKLRCLPGELLARLSHLAEP